MQLKIDWFYLIVQDDEGDECACCLEVMHETQNLQHLECGHVFHDTVSRINFDKWNMFDKKNRYTRV